MDERRELERTVVSGPVRPGGRPVPGRPVLGLLALLLVAGAAIGLWIRARPRAPRVPAPSPAARPRSALPGTPSASPVGPVPPPATSIFPRWARVDPVLSRVRGTATADPGLEQRLDALAGMNLGRSLEAWTHWVALGRWLEKPGRSLNPPRYRRWHKGPMSVLEFLLVIQIMQEVRHGRPELIYPTLLRWLGERPEDGRLWIMLMELLEREGMPALAAAAAEMGLRNMVKSPDLPRVFWGSLARSLALAPGHDPVTEFWRWAPTDRVVEVVFDGLDLGLGRPDTEAAYLATVRAGKEFPALAEYAAGELARYTLARDRAPGRSLLEQALSRDPASIRLRSMRVECHLLDGDLPAAREDVRGLPEGSCLSEEVGILTSAPAPGAKSRGGGRPAAVLAFRHLEAGRMERAAEEARRYFLQSCEVLPAEAVPVDGLLLELIAAGSGEPWLIDSIRQALLSRSFRWNLLCFHAGPGPSGPGTTRVAELLGMDRPETRDDPIRWTTQVLWLSRSQQHEAVLILLDGAPGDGLGGIEKTALAEALARPIWHRALGRAVPEQVIRRCRDRCVILKDTIFKAYLEALAAGDMPEAGRRAGWLFLNFRPLPAFALAALWGASLGGDREERAAWERRLTVHVRHQAAGRWALAEARLARP